MKKALLAFVAAIFVTTAVSAQSVNKGNFFFNTSGSTSITQSSVDMSITPSPFRFGVNGSGGYFVMDNLAVVAGVDLGVVGKTTVTDAFGIFGLRAGARYYFAPVGPGIFFADATFGFQKWGSNKIVGDFSLNAGYSIFFNEHVAVEPMLQLRVPFNKGHEVELALGAAFAVYF